MTSANPKTQRTAETAERTSTLKPIPAKTPKVGTNLTTPNPNVPTCKLAIIAAVDPPSAPTLQPASAEPPLAHPPSASSSTLPSRPPPSLHASSESIATTLTAPSTNLQLPTCNVEVIATSTLMHSSNHSSTNK